jgi:putative CocE/NonD family hydrolase
MTKWLACGPSVVLLLASSAANAVVVHDVPMSDGTALNTQVYLPGDDEVTPRAVILVRTPYGATNAANATIFNLLMPDHQWMTDRGWAYVVQDARGTGESEGGATLRFIDDLPDSQDTLAWIDQQPWSNGRVAMWGVSALAINGLLAIQDAPPSSTRWPRSSCLARRSTRRPRSAASSRGA